MDRPQDMEVNSVNGRIYLVLTNNNCRTDRDKDAPNPRSDNRTGHILEITEDDGDYASTKFFLLCGDPANPAHQPTYFAGFDPKLVSALATPDNIVFDSRGTMWIATDGQPGAVGFHDGVYAVPTDGPDRVTSGSCSASCPAPKYRELSWRQTIHRCSWASNTRTKAATIPIASLRTGRMESSLLSPPLLRSRSF